MINLSSDEVLHALRSMKSFFHELAQVYANHGMSIDSNIGRRNILMSAAQEHFFAEKIRQHIPGATADGVTGRPDICLGDGRELECKLTTPIKPGMIMLQTDWVTLQKKGTLDYLYVIADASFEKFCVLHCSGLTADDFHAPPPSSRGKAQMKKHKAMTKTKVLWGEVVDSRLRDIESAKQQLASLGHRSQLTRRKLEERIARLEQADSYYSFALHQI
jgi:hypothetical protein